MRELILQKILNANGALSSLSVGVVGSMVIHAKVKHMARETIQHEWNQVRVEVPDTVPPEWGQESVDVAMAMYGIKIPSRRSSRV